MADIPQTLTNWYNSKQQSGGGNGVNTGMLSTAASSSDGVTPQASVTGYQAATLGTPTSWNVTPEQTQQGQLSSILKSDSPLMQQAETKGLQQANARGLLNSSMAVGAAQDSMIAAAQPISAADAQTNAQAAGYNADQANTFSKANQSAENTAAGFNAAASNSIAQSNAKTQADVNLAYINNQANLDQQLSSGLSSLNQGFNNNIQAIQGSTTLDQQAKDYYINQLVQGYKAQISMMSAVGKVPNVADLLTFDMPNSGPPAPGVVYAPAQAPQPAPAQSSGGGSVLCTYYHDMGFMDDETYKADADFGDRLLIVNPGIVVWYWLWATPFVAFLKRNAKFSLLINTVWFFIDAWAKEIAHKAGIRKKGSYLGRAMYAAGTAVYGISQFLKRVKRGSIH